MFALYKNVKQKKQLEVPHDRLAFHVIDYAMQPQLFHKVSSLLLVPNTTITYMDVE